MKLTILGSGTSHGVPVIACNCKVCKSGDKKDNRLRASALLSIKDVSGDRNFLIDVGPDFREQALRINLCRLDAVFLTHPHADHIHGIDDLRIFSHKNSSAMNCDERLSKKFPETAGKGLAMYMSSDSEKCVKTNFHYIFMTHEKGGGTPKLNIIDVDSYNEKNPLELGELCVVPVPMEHGCIKTTGWIFSKKLNGKKHSIAYLTDCNFISENSLNRVKNACADGILDHLVIDALRADKHSSHNNFDQALFYADKIGAVHTWFTHLSHDFLHGEIQDYIDKKLPEFTNLQKIVENGGTVSPAFDGLELDCK